MMHYLVTPQTEHTRRDILQLLPSGAILYLLCSPIYILSVSRLVFTKGSPNGGFLVVVSKRKNEQLISSRNYISQPMVSTVELIHRIN